MSRSQTLLLLTALCPFVVLAEPTYLDCQLSKGANEKSKFSLKLDEASGKVTHTSYDGSAFNADGFFAANTISYQQIIVENGIKLTKRYEIDRTTLKFNSVWVLEPVDPGIAWDKKPTTLEGNCSVVKVSGRKI